MIRQEKLDLASIEGQTFIIGREGHIFIEDATVSRRHAALRINAGKVYLEDLGSRNGTYLIKNRHLTMVEGGSVSLLQPVLIGEQVFRVIDLLSTACKFYCADGAETKLVPVQGNIAV